MNAVGVGVGVGVGAVTMILIPIITPCGRRCVRVHLEPLFLPNIISTCGVLGESSS